MALDMMIAGAMRESLPETQADWWSRFVSLSQQIAERAAPPALPPSS